MTSSFWTRLAGWTSLGLLALLAAGGAATAQGRILLGAPAILAVVLLLVSAMVLAISAPDGAIGGCAGLLFVPVLVLAGLASPALKAFTGPPLFALVLAGAALVLATSRRPTWRPRVFFPAVLVLYALGAARTQAQVGPEGDEPHYLMVAESLLRDRDLSLESDYAEGRYRSFHPAELAPHYRVRGKHGEIYSLHAVGLSVLILPAYAVGGYAGVSFFMAFLAALAAREIRELVRTSTGAAGLAEGMGWVVALSPPLAHYAGLVFTEVPAALAVAVVLRGRSANAVALPAERGRAGAWALAEGLAIALLPWLNVRYTALALVLLVYQVYRSHDTRARLILLAPAALSAVGLGLFHYSLYGFFDPRLVYGRRPELSLRLLPDGLAGMLLDQEFGLLVYAPVYVLAFPGLVLLVHRDLPRALCAAALVASALVIAGSWPMWRGGFNPPARFLVPVVGPLALMAAGALRRGLRPAAALLIGWSVWIGAAGVLYPRFVHRDRDGTAPLFRNLSGAEEWTRLLPGYVLPESAPDRLVLSLLWGSALAVAAGSALRSRGSGPGRVALATAGLLGVAATASLLAHARTGGRDAVRVVGRPALEVPGWRPARAATGSWGPEDLLWGPPYEPHRYPEGAEVGTRLPLPAGRYRLRLQVEELSAAGSGVLEVRPAPGRPILASVLLMARIGERKAVFDVPFGEREVTLAVRGGGPFLLHRVGLDGPTFPGPPGLKD